jgi:hypothetical protein
MEENVVTLLPAPILLGEESGLYFTSPTNLRSISNKKLPLFNCMLFLLMTYIAHLLNNKEKKARQYMKILIRAWSYNSTNQTA